MTLKNFVCIVAEILTEDMVQWTDITCGKKYDLVILHVDEKEFDQDCSFWATDMSSNNFCSLYETLMPKLNSYCNAVHEPYSPQIREVCLARFEGGCLFDFRQCRDV